MKENAFHAGKMIGEGHEKMTGRNAGNIPMPNLLFIIPIFFQYRIKTKNYSLPGCPPFAMHLSSRPSVLTGDCLLNILFFENLS